VREFVAEEDCDAARGVGEFGAEIEGFAVNADGVSGIVIPGDLAFEAVGFAFGFGLNDEGRRLAADAGGLGDAVEDFARVSFNIGGAGERTAEGEKY